MTKIYKVQYNIQSQTMENGRIQKHRKAISTLPATALLDMGVTEEENTITIFYDEENKQIIIKKF